MINLTPHADGTILPVKALASARRDALTGAHNGALKVAVTAAAEKGKANKAIADVLAKTLRLKKGAVELVRGKTSTQKQFLIRGLNVEELQCLIEGTLDS